MLWAHSIVYHTSAFSIFKIHPLSAENSTLSFSQKLNPSSSNGHKMERGPLRLIRSPCQVLRSQLTFVPCELWGDDHLRSRERVVASSRADLRVFLTPCIFLCIELELNFPEMHLAMHTCQQHFQEILKSITLRNFMASSKSASLCLDLSVN